MLVVVLYFLLLLLNPAVVLHLLLLLLPATLLNLSVQLRLHFFTFAIQLLLLSEVELLGEQPSIVAALLQLLHFLFIKHQIIISNNKL